MLDTTLGSITLELDEDKAPATTANFLAYVNDGFYNGTVFHRVIPGFMIQGGGFDTDLKQKPTRAPIAHEGYNGLKNTRGTIAMARTSDPHSATAQFFINVVDNAFLDPSQTAADGYVVFGKVVSGMDVADKIAALPTGSKGMFDQDVPQPLVVIQSATLVSTDTAKETP
ncbi:MAG: peptidylprolyl isomerase [Cardiobacteriaceae bacterium]|nr:peptidylprolyl isomerase [Cardiobacteriaceae bacterium]